MQTLRVSERAGSDGILHLRPGLASSTTDLSRHLVEHGYIAESMVSGPGEFARRGGVMDIFPVGSQAPVRVEFDASRMNEDVIMRLLKQAGLDVRDRLSLA